MAKKSDRKSEPASKLKQQKNNRKIVIEEAINELQGGYQCEE
jgi:hypothetical protein